MSDQQIRKLSKSSTTEDLIRAVNLLIDGYTTQQHFAVLTVEPPTDYLSKGLVVYADGTLWDPGSGEGLYEYTGVAWAKL